jgi:ferritin
MSDFYGKLADWCDNYNLSLLASLQLDEIVTPKIEQLQKENEEFRAVLQFIADIEQERLDEVSGMADTALATTKRG